MKTVTRRIAIAFAFIFLCFISAAAQEKSIEGNWMGTADVGGVKLRLAVHVTRDAAGRLAATLDSIDQGAKDLPFDTVELQGATVRFGASAMGVVYDAKINENADELAGVLKQGGGEFPLVLTRGEIKRAYRPQDPKKPYPYTEEEVVYENKADSVKLAGTLTLPRGNGPHPAVILITGSGSQDRDETVFEHRPFLVIADRLTRNGIAVLRVDDRGIGGSSPGLPAATTENLMGDVLAGVEFLKARKEIDPKQIGLIGHSEGGMIAPMAAARSKNIAFIVMMAGLGQTGGETLFAQTALLRKAQGDDPVAIGQNLTALKNIFPILKSEPDNKLAEQRINEALDRQSAGMSEDARKIFAPLAADFRAQMQILLLPAYRYFVAFDPQPVLRKVKVPVLAVGGENDLQVPADENLMLIAAALKAGKNTDYTTKAFPGLNHLFQTSKTGLISEYGTIEETISPEVLDVITAWVLKHVQSPKSRVTRPND